ncbi:hypothetical protein F2Q68_00016261 [Brassica cretica]|uniref:Uncharacterized protein n=2 Tax=Brassica cretica TaxID=69181 RepID=A0ABQ7F6F4_BRACR|nr:hypothetical protein F2Q68_00016261 [Brassica cretica]KAF3611616.1 hypothetical protein DY000_02048710 [Brassica cretica]
MYKEQKIAIVAKHEEDIEVNRIQAKLELLDELIKLSALKSEKEKLEADLRLAQAKEADVKVPNIDWFKLGEPKMYD